MIILCGIFVISAEVTPYRLVVLLYTVVGKKMDVIPSLGVAVQTSRVSVWEKDVVLLCVLLSLLLLVCCCCNSLLKLNYRHAICGSEEV